MDIGSMLGVLGMNVIVNPNAPDEVPRYRLSNHVQVSDEFRAEYNEWLRDFFGTDLSVYVFGGNVIASPRMAGIIKNLSA